MIWKKGKYLKTSTMVTVIFMQSVMEIALPVKKLSYKNWSNLKNPYFKNLSKNGRNSIVNISKTKSRRYLFLCIFANYTNHYMYCHWRSKYQEGRVWIPLTGLTSPHFFACLKPPVKTTCYTVIYHLLVIQ
jgi:hypothetical protein